MRALCGAIITAGALIGLGFTALGIGTRYQNYTGYQVPTSGANDFHDPLLIRFKALDSSLMMILLFLIVMAVTGLVLAFVGLALHHERRKHERGLLSDEPSTMTRGSMGSPALTPGVRP
jgi:hypothetical protein